MRELDLSTVGERPEAPPTVESFTFSYALDRAFVQAGRVSPCWNGRFRWFLAVHGLCIIRNPGFLPLPPGMCYAPPPFGCDEGWSAGSVIVKRPNCEHLNITDYPYTKTPVDEQAATATQIFWDEAAEMVQRANMLPPEPRNPEPDDFSPTAAIARLRAIGALGAPRELREDHF